MKRSELQNKLEMFQLKLANTKRLNMFTKVPTALRSSLKLLVEMPEKSSHYGVIRKTQIMRITVSDIDTFLQKLDIEGFINLGTPSDEYSYEARTIMSKLEQFPMHELNAPAIEKIISDIWIQSFNLGPEEIILRMPDIENLTRLILENESVAQTL